MIDGENEDQELLLDTTASEGEEGEASQDQEGQQDAQAADDVLTIEIEGDDLGEDTPLVRRLRQEAADAKREAAALRKTTRPKIEVGEEPTLEGCDYNEDHFKAQWRKWNEDRQRAAAVEHEQAEIASAQQRKFERVRSQVIQKVASYGVDDVDAAEKRIVEALGPEISSLAMMAIPGADKLFAALAKSPRHLSEIASHTDQTDRLRMLIELKDKIVIKNGKKPPAPEADTILRSTTSVAAKVDATEQRLEKEAERTNDYTKLFEYRRGKRKAA